MNNYVQRGDTLTVTAPYALLSGGGCQVGTIFGVTVNTQNLGDSTELVVEGVFDLAKDASTFVSGAKVYWDNSQQLATANILTAAGAANKEIGFACWIRPAVRRRRAARPPIRPCVCGSIRSASAPWARQIWTRRCCRRQWSR